MIPITLYTKSECGLCEAFKQDLETAVTTNPHFAYTLTEVDITQDDTLFAKYRYSIPVVEIGTTTLHAPITVSEIIGALETAVSPR